MGNASQPDVASEEEWITLRVSILLNSALVALKQNTTASLHLAVKQASRALDMHCDPVEVGKMIPMTKKLTPDEMGRGYYRRGLAHSMLKDYDEAQKDLQSALAAVPGDKAVEAELKRIVAKKEELKKKQQKAFGKMFA